jgi:AcrR family transcriptional regulator
VSDKRNAILQATLTLISQHGFHGTSMSQIAREAGVSAGIIYHYFEGKDDLIDELYRTIKRNFGQAAVRDFERDQPLKAQIRQLLGIMIRYYVQRPLESAFLEQYTRSPYYRLAIEVEASQYYLPVLETFQAGRQEMIIKDLPPSVIAAFTLDVATSLAQQHAAGFVSLTDELIAQIIEASWEAIRQ